MLLCVLAVYQNDCFSATKKQITHFYGFRSGSHYFLELQLDNRQDKISINLGTKNEAAEDSAVYKIHTDKIYTFYLDPTVPTTDGVNPGIDKVDYRGVEVYRVSNNLNFYGGLMLSFVGLGGTILVLAYKKNATVDNK